MNTRTLKSILDLTILIIGIIICLIIYNFQNNQYIALSKRLESEKNKNEILKKIVDLENKITEIRKLLKRKDTSEIITTVTQLAEQSGLNVIKIQPEEKEEKKNPIYVRSALRFSLESESYHAIGNFIAKLESHPDIYRVESLSIKPTKRTANLQIKEGIKIEKETVLNVDILIVRFIFTG